MAPGQTGLTTFGRWLIEIHVLTTHLSHRRIRTIFLCYLDCEIKTINTEIQVSNKNRDHLVGRLMTHTLHWCKDWSCPLLYAIWMNNITTDLCILNNAITGTHMRHNNKCQLQQFGRYRDLASREECSVHAFRLQRRSGNPDLDCCWRLISFLLCHQWKPQRHTGECVAFIRQGQIELSRAVMMSWNYLSILWSAPNECWAVVWSSLTQPPSLNHCLGRWFVCEWSLRVLCETETSLWEFSKLFAIEAIETVL